MTTEPVVLTLVMNWYVDGAAENHFRQDYGVVWKIASVSVTVPSRSGQHWMVVSMTLLENEEGLMKI